jgi:Flp pilus assembly protein TadD
MRWRVFLILACVGFLAAPLARADETLQQKYLNIYLKINEAEQMERHGDFRGALEDFKDCYEGLAKINRSDPNWETALVLHRMADCKAKIIELQPKADAQPAAAEVQTPDLNAQIPNSVTTGDSTEVAELKQDLDAVRAELAVTKQNLQQANSQSDAYRTQLEAVNQQMAALKGQATADAKIARLTAENKELTDKLADAEKDLDGFRNNPKSKLAQAEVQVKNLQDQLAASQDANKALQDTTTTLKQQLDQANADLVTANQKLAAAGPGSAEYLRLKRENEIMRGILQRELQEQGRRDMAKKLIEEEFDNLKLKSTVLQEHLDEATSVMTPPTTDEERELLASLRPSSPDVVAPPATAPDTFSAQVTPSASGDTNAAPGTPTPPAASPDTNVGTTAATPTNTVASATPPTAGNSTTNAAPVQIVMNGGDATPTNAAPTAATDTSTNPAAPAAPTTSATDVTTTSTPPATTTPDTNSAPMPPTTIGNQQPPVTPPASVTDTMTPAVPSKTVSQVPPAQTEVQDTTVTTTQQPDTSADPTQYSTKARLPDDMRETAQEAADLFKNQKYDESAAKYQSIIDKYPESLYAWSNLGVVRFQQGKFDDALKALQQAVKLSPTDAFSYSNLGIVYYQLNQYENAIEALNAAKALDPTDAKTHNYLGCACSQKGWSEVAEKEFRKAIELDQNFGDAHFNLALVYATQKPPLLELARREYNSALELGIAKDPRLEKLLEGSMAESQPQVSQP